MLEVNVDDDQIDDLVDDALQLFHERHFDGVERMYLKHKITQDDIDRVGAKIVSGETTDWWKSVGIHNRYHYININTGITTWDFYFL